MEQEPTYKKEMIRWAKAHVQSAQVEANRQFFDEFDAIVENDAIEAHKFLRDYKKRIADPDDVHLEIEQCEEARKASGLPQRVVILPDWDFGDEKRYEEEQAKKKKHAANRRRKKTKKRAPKLAIPPQQSTADSQPDATPKHEEEIRRWRSANRVRSCPLGTSCTANNTPMSVARSWIGSIMHSRMTCFVSTSDSKTKPNCAGESARPW
jgi:hypothetical protein